MCLLLCRAACEAGGEVALRVDDFDYELPPELIAQTPLLNRDESRLLVVHRESGSIEHRTFKDVPNYLDPGDMLVVNDTRVIPARLHGHRETGGKVEVLLLRDLGGDRWECLVKPGHKVRIGDTLAFGEGPGDTVYRGSGVDLRPRLRGVVVSRTGYGGRVIEWHYEGTWEETIGRLGEMPLPPYIKTALSDQERYQTVYSNVPGSAAAPTAGLHFTPELLDQVRAKGVSVEALTLNVGLATFRPVKEETVEEHRIHEEYFVIGDEAALAIKRLRERGERGERGKHTQHSEPGGKLKPFAGDTDLFIFPGFRFHVVDRLITNFHLPRSTLLMLVSAFAGRDLIMRAYKEAVRERYRFFSFGDAMLIL